MDDYIKFVTKCKSSFKFFAESEAIDQSYYPEPIKIHDFQLEWINAVEEHDKVALTAHTGSGKSTVLGVLYPLWKHFLNEGFESLIVSDRMEQSIKIMDEIKHHINNSKVLKDLRPDDKEKTWQKQHIKLSNGGEIYCKPYTESVKSVHADYALCDEAAEFKDHSIYRRYVRTRVARKNGTITLISTPVHENDLMQKLSKGQQDEDHPNISKKGYWNKTYPVIDKETEEPLCEDNFDKEDIEELKQEDPMMFQKEYLCEPLAVEGDFFDPNDIIDCYDESEGFRQTSKDNATYYLGCDFAISKQGDYSVYTVLEKHPEKSAPVLRYMERIRGMGLEEQEQRIKELHKIFDFRRIIVDETNFGHRTLMELQKSGLPVEGQSFDVKARNNLLVNIKNTIEKGQLIIPRDDESDMTTTLTDQLYNELLGFGVTETDSGSVSYQSTAKHDDTVVSLGMALNAVEDEEPAEIMIAHN